MGSLKKGREIMGEEVRALILPRDVGGSREKFTS